MAKKRFRGSPITPMAYWQKHGRVTCEKLAADAGTSYDYWKRICNLRVRPSIDLARKLVELTDGEISLELLLPPLKELRGIGAPPMANGNKVGAMRKQPAEAVA